jgi:beta-barrel assembly-enhancing protease
MTMAKALQLATAALVAGGLVVGCAQLRKVPGLGSIIKANEDLTPENEYYVGRSVATKILAKYDYKYLDKEAVMAGRFEGVTEYVNRVGNILAAKAIEVPRKGDRPAPIAGYHFLVLDAPDEVNAFSAPGGYILVTSGAVKLAKTEDELAAVLAHEIGHVVRGHALGTIKAARFAGLTKSALDVVQVEGNDGQQMKLTEAFGGSLDDIIDGMTVKGYSQESEFDADKVGINLMLRAGYDPAAFVRYLKALEVVVGANGGGFNATHPKASARIAKLEVHIKKMGPHKVAQARTDRFLAATASLRQ